MPMYGVKLTWKDKHKSLIVDLVKFNLSTIIPPYRHKDW